MAALAHAWSSLSGRLPSRPHDRPPRPRTSRREGRFSARACAASEPCCVRSWRPFEERSARARRRSGDAHPVLRNRLRELQRRGGSGATFRASRERARHQSVTGEAHCGAARLERSPRALRSERGVPLLRRAHRSCGAHGEHLAHRRELHRRLGRAQAGDREPWSRSTRSPKKRSSSR